MHIAVDAILALNPQTIPETIHVHFLDSDAPWEGYVWKSILQSIQMNLIGIYLIILKKVKEKVFSCLENVHFSNKYVKKKTIING